MLVIFFEKNYQNNVEAHGRAPLHSYVLFD